MADTTWTGSVSGAFATAGNWDNGVPGTGDTAIFTGGAIRKIDGSDQTAITLAQLIVDDSYALGIASGGSPLKIHADQLTYGAGGGLAFLWGEYPDVVAAPKARLDLYIGGASNAVIRCLRGTTYFWRGEASGSILAMVVANNAVVRMDLNISGQACHNLGCYVSTDQVTWSNYVAIGGQLDYTEDDFGLPFVAMSGGSIKWDSLFEVGQECMLGNSAVLDMTGGRAPGWNGLYVLPGSNVDVRGVFDLVETATPQVIGNGYVLQAGTSYDVEYH